MQSISYFILLVVVGVASVSTAALPKSVGSTKKEETPQSATIKNLNDMLRSFTNGDPTLNGHVTRALDDFVSTVLPGHCQQIQQIQSEFFANLKKTTNMEIDNQTTSAFEELMSSMMPAVCGRANTKNLVTKSSATNTIFDQLDRFGDLLKLKEGAAVKSMN